MQAFSLYRNPKGSKNRLRNGGRTLSVVGKHGTPRLSLDPFMVLHQHTPTLNTTNKHARTHSLTQNSLHVK